MKTLSTALFSVLAAMAISSVTLADPASTDAMAKHDKKGYFAHIDTNGDGVITKDEATTAALKRFEKMDANGDGQVTKEEAKAAHKKYKDEKRSCKDKKAK
ncbi:hypothetical protein [Methylophaga sulfidovorans]|uniref:EF hand n=1 Tax=Methylophaga sulfidovorans TaxID=45496 RepID=A0A1I3Z2Y3_9GAMM|nr:hypothetical protein [Methylophaga sulfidovorans]SFK38414.1 EF hand [Methylophaga sulfidovorans]